jgi:microcin C transport system substrate-binding protein
MKIQIVRAAALAFAIAAVGCGGGTNSTENQSTSAPGTPSTDGRNVATNKNAYPVFPDADAGADPAVSGEQGGRGFTGQGWETNTDYDLIGDPHAIKGGTLRQGMMTDFPSTLRYYGPNVTVWNLRLQESVYESLLMLHPTTLQYIPALATHWQISDDKKTFRFRLNPNARWSDGMPVTSEDVIASWKLVVDKTLQDPARTLTYSNFEQPVAESKYIVSVRAKTQNWQNFTYFACGPLVGGFFIYPAHVLKTINGEAYVRDYNYKMLPGTGPYMVTDQDLEKGKSIRVRRRKDYWAENHRRNIGLHNFDQIQQAVVRDRGLEFEMFKKGDLDYFFVQRAQMWVEELNYPNVKRGVNQKRKIFTNNPNGISGIAINTRREPFNDIRVRKALGYLFNRELMVQKLMFNEYVLIDSIFPGSVYENSNDEKVRYDPAKALQLLVDAGWKGRDNQGRLVRNGQPLTFELTYGDQQAERYLTIFQEDLRKVGITLNLRLITWETLIKLLDDRSFSLAEIAYTGELFPSPEQNWLSRLADEKNTNNITGFKNKRADEIIDTYTKEFDFSKRVKLMQEFDLLVTSDHNWVFQWTAPYERVVYWNKFGAPRGYLARVGDYDDIRSLWWFDPEKTRKLDEAMRNTSIQLGEGPSDDKYWLDYSKAEAAQTTTSTQ